MINRQHTIRMFQRTVTQIMRTAISAGSAAGLLALTIAVRPMGAQQPTAVRVPASVLERNVGEYVYPDGSSTLAVNRIADTLFHETPGKRSPYRPLTETLFFLPSIYTAEFVIDRAGGATQILTDGVGFEARLRRKGSPPENPAASLASPGVRVPRSVLQRYVGVYEYIPGQMSRTDLRVVVRLKGDTLIRWMGKESVLTPISETLFKVGNTQLVTEFVVDDAGVTQVMGSGFQQMLARLPAKR